MPDELQVVVVKSTVIEWFRCNDGIKTEPDSSAPPQFLRKLKKEHKILIYKNERYEKFS